jgi:DNA-binding MarR family transcriptional regulator
MVPSGAALSGRWVRRAQRARAPDDWLERGRHRLPAARWRVPARLGLCARPLCHYVDVNINAARPRAQARRLTPRPAHARAQALTLLRLLVDTLRRSARTVERRTGITNAQLFLLQRLREEGSLTVNELAERARTDHSTVSTVVRRLVKARLASKLRSEPDLRRVAVSITAKGRRLVRAAPAPPTAKVLRALERITDQDARALARGLRSLARALHLTPRHAAMLFEDPPRRRAAR